jgi:hypothetical protein
MKIIETSKSGNIVGFFEKHCILMHKYSSGLHNLSIDGTGVVPSVDEKIADSISRYILKKFKTADSFAVLDIGTGIGHMVNGLNNNGIDGYGFEGSSRAVDKSICQKNKISVLDMSIKIEDAKLKNCVNLTTSFELLEHIHRDHEDMFFRNLAYLSNYHLCSINMDEWPGTSYNHCNIKHLCCWLELFRKYEITYEILGEATKGGPVQKHKGDVGVPFYINKTHNEEFRENTGCDWHFSMFCLLDFTNSKLI